MTVLPAICPTRLCFTSAFLPWNHSICRERGVGILPPIAPGTCPSTAENFQVAHGPGNHHVPPTSWKSLPTHSIAIYHLLPSRPGLLYVGRFPLSVCISSGSGLRAEKQGLGNLICIKSSRRMGCLFWKDRYIFDLFTELSERGNDLRFPQRDFKLSRNFRGEQDLLFCCHMRCFSLLLSALYFHRNGTHLC